MGAEVAVASRLRLAKGSGTVLDEVRMSEYQLEHRREPPPLQPCWRGAGTRAGGAGLICTGGSRLALHLPKTACHPSCGFRPTLLVLFVVGLLCACPRCFLAAHMVTSNTMSLKTPLTESDQGNLVGNFLA